MFRIFRINAGALVKITMAMETILDELAHRIAQELEIELKRVCPVKTGELRGSIKVVKDGDDYVIQMRDYWRTPEYLSNPFIRFTLNTKMPDILKKVTNGMSR